MEIVVNDINIHMPNISPLKHSSGIKILGIFLINVRDKFLEALDVVFDSNDSLLYPMLLKLLLQDLLLDFNKTKCVGTDYNIKDLMKFLMKELNSRERMKAMMAHQRNHDSWRQLYPNSIITKVVD